MKTASVHIAHWGVFVTTPTITKEKSVVRIKTKIENQSHISTEVTVNAEICYLGNKKVAASLIKFKVNVPADSVN